METFEKRTVGYTALPRPVTDDARLTFKALGLLAYLLSMPDDWRPNYKHLAKTHADGEHSVRMGLAELEAYGYYSRQRVRHEDGTFGWKTIVSETPSLLDPGSDEPVLDYPAPVERGSTNDSGTMTKTEGEVEAYASPSPRSAVDSEFDAFWANYPKKVGKGAARTAYARALRKTGANVILSALSDYVASREGKDKQYTLNPATWLNQEHWEDEAVDPFADIVPDDAEWYYKLKEKQKR